MTDPRISEYELRHNVQLLKFLGPGPGQDGFVLQSDRITAVKFFDRNHRFDRELEVYQVLLQRGIRDVAGHRVPKLYGWDEELKAIEMTIVERHSCSILPERSFRRKVPDFEPHVMEEHFEHLQELFGEQWSDAMHVAEMFRQATGFTLLDIHPGNIAFAD